MNPAIVEDKIVGSSVITVSASDSDSTTTSHGQVTYSFATGSNPAKFSVDSATGVVSLSSPLDYETDSSNTYTLLVVASDGSLSSTVTVTVPVSDVNDNAPVFSTSASYRSIFVIFISQDFCYIGLLSRVV